MFHLLFWAAFSDFLVLVFLKWFVSLSRPPETGGCGTVCALCTHTGSLVESWGEDIQHSTFEAV